MLIREEVYIEPIVEPIIENRPGKTIILSDIDGTVFSNSVHGIPSLTKTCIKNLDQATTYFLPVTARPYELLKPIISELLLQEGISVTDNGASVVSNQSGEAIWSDWISAEKIQEIIGKLGAISSILCCSPIHNPLEGKRIAMAMNGLGITDSPNIFSVFEETHIGTVKAFAAQLTEYCITPPMKYENTSQYCVQVTNKSVNKAAGAQRAISTLGTVARTIAIGDSYADLPLFAYADIAVAMDNAPEELKKVADFVTGDVDADGFVTAMRWLGMTDQ